MAVHIALLEIGVPFETRVLSLAKKETRTAEFLALNPAGKVPLLLIDGRPLAEGRGLPVLSRQAFPGSEAAAGGRTRKPKVRSSPGFPSSPPRCIRRDGRGWNMPTRSGRSPIEDSEAIHGFSVSTPSSTFTSSACFWRMAGSLEPPPGTLTNLFAHRERMMARAAVQRTIESESSMGYDLPA